MADDCVPGGRNGVLDADRVGVTVSDVILLDNGDAVDADTGEFLRVANIDDGLKFVAAKRHEAKAQEDAYKAYRVVLDQVLLKNQVERRTIYDELDVRIAGGSYTTFDVTEWRAGINELELSRSELLGIVLAGTGFDRAALVDLPTDIVELFDAALKHHEKRPWVMSQLVRKPAPVLRHEARAEGGLEGWAETVEAFNATR